MSSTADRSQPTQDSPGTLPRNIGRYQILRQLGSGGMGIVYQAHDAQLDRQVAVKLPHFDGGAGDRAVRLARFQRETRAAAAVMHPRVCPVFDVGEQDGQPYVVMAYVPGESLADHLARAGRHDDTQHAVQLALHILDGLEAVHRHGIIHRDLKPGNIMLDSAKLPVLTDFGLALPQAPPERLTSDGLVIGTPSYMAPEQAEGKTENIGPWTDIYSLGVILYQMVTGRLPFEGHGLAVLAQVVSSTPPAPSQFRPEIDAQLEAVLLKALARSPADRYRSAREFAQALRGCNVPANLPVTALMEAPAIGSADKTVVHAVSGAVKGRRRGSVQLVIAILSAGCGYYFFCLPITPAGSWLATAAWTLAVGLLLSELESRLPVRLQERLRRPLRVLGEVCAFVLTLSIFCGGLALMFAVDGSVTRLVPDGPGHSQIVIASIPVWARITGFVMALVGLAAVVFLVLRGLWLLGGASSLCQAAASGQKFIVTILLDSGIAVDGKDEVGETALMKAAAHGQLEVVKLLLARGANVSEKTRFGQTALDLCTTGEHADRIAVLLRRAGATGAIEGVPTNQKCE